MNFVQYTMSYRSKREKEIPYLEYREGLREVSARNFAKPGTPNNSNLQINSDPNSGEVQCILQPE